MTIVNADVAAVFSQIADLLEVQGANTFRIRAYRNAARNVGELGRSVSAMLEAGENLDELPGIGPDLAGKIAEIAASGSCAQLEQLREELPPAITELLAIPRLGPKRVRTLHQQLGIKTIAELLKAARSRRIRMVPGFGPKMERLILDAATARLAQERRFKLAVAGQVSDALLADLRQVPGVRQAVAAGSLRRMRDTVGDLDLLVTIDRGSEVMQRFVTAPDVDRVLSKGSTRASVVLRSGMQADLRAVPQASFGAAWLYFTGSKAHNIALRRTAQEAGLKLNEYGLYRGSERLAGETEVSVYRALGLPFIEPELREDRGEIEAARAGRLPHLVRMADLRGDLHSHTSESDGSDTLEAMARAAMARGWRYLAVTEHTQRLAVARGLDAQRLARQIDRIDELNATLGGFVILKGIEVDILEDGSLDLPDAVLQRLDLVIGAVHHRFELPREQQTERLLRAMDHRYFSILAHPTGRLIDERPPCDIDLARVIRAARQRGCCLELNAHPARLDLVDTACRMARDEGVLVSIASDAHSTLEFGHLALGVAQARRGWLEPGDVLNTRELPQLRRLLAATMGRGAPAPRRRKPAAAHASAA
ncbi:DNA polymerase/3'-5' exonuclease PolX [Ramlibacter sp.]|uniref:DNA polymerase/3'-5' exonuclease PolX n=1 Tax=Ramlibacter sp. TaxID=1917967 RepID=UPI002CDF49A3|nr:DNA polymerase/3'-5' exonuclease PolX [Ramlibacter sp.]HWI81130.1 DNA polymerase/3'-5' exonuclease PolX [Ramlibacter sp.]